MSTISTMPSTPAILPGMSGPPRLAPSPAMTARLYRLTVRQYDQMVRDGTIGAKDRVELIEGILVTKMSKNPPHVVAGNIGRDALARIVPPGWYVAKEDPIVASDWSEPEPDLAIIRGQARDYINGNVMAANVALVVEIAESSLSADRTDMTRVYAASGIAVYWIVNLVDGQVEVYTGPGPAGYQGRRDFKPGQDVPVVVDGVEVGRIPVVDILP